MDVFVQAFVQGLTLAALYLPIALGLNLVFGVLHIINFAHGDLYMLGAMLTWWGLTSSGLGFVPSLVIAVGLVTLLGIVIDRVLLRAMGHDVLAIRMDGTRHLQVSKHGQCRKQIEFLKHKPDAIPAQASPLAVAAGREFDSVQDHLSRCRPIEATEKVQ